MSSFPIPIPARAFSSIYICVLLTFCLVIWISGFLFGFSLVSLREHTHNFKYGNLSISVQRNDGLKRPKVLGFIGVQTSFGNHGRRRALRQTWFPADHPTMQRLEESTGLVLRFVMGTTSDSSKMTELNNEVAEYDDFLLLDIEDSYINLPHKTLAFFKAPYTLYDADFYIKSDDDLYLRPDRLSLLLAKDRLAQRTYIGCMRKGPVITDPNHKWYEPLSDLIGNEYFSHAYGSFYALSNEIVASLSTFTNGSLRMFSNEDISIGAWMLALDVNHENVNEICADDCSESSIAVWAIDKCPGPCDPEKAMLEAHARDICSKNSTNVPTGEDETS